jgi:uncharacterized protein
VVLVDANILIYAANRSSQQHEVARRWLDAALGGGESVGLAWIVLLAYLRVVTHPRLLEAPITAAVALEQIARWRQASAARIVHPGERHAEVLERLLADLPVAGNLVNDVHLAALATEHGARVASFDRDFARFPGLRTEVPG